MAKTKPGMRVALQLDTRIALEAIILNRLLRITANRRQEWLRGLLVQGFRQECQALRGTMDETQQPAGMAFTPRLKGTMTSSSDNPMALPNTPSPAAGSTGKPFAALGRVIG